MIIDIDRHYLDFQQSIYSLAVLYLLCRIVVFLLELRPVVGGCIQYLLAVLHIGRGQIHVVLLALSGVSYELVAGLDPLSFFHISVFYHSGHVGIHRHLAVTLYLSGTGEYGRYGALVCDHHLQRIRRKIVIKSSSGRQQYQ